MKRAVSGIVLAMLLTCLFTQSSKLQTSKAERSTILVPDDYPTIQAAVSAATTGYTVVIRNGTYVENVKVNKDNLTIKSEEGPESTLVHAANSNDDVFHITAGNVILDGFAVTGATGGFMNAGVCLSNAHFCTISHMSSFNNSRGILLKDSSTNMIFGNEVFWNLNAIALDGSSSYNTVTGNNASFNSGDCIVTYESSQNNKIIGNTANSNFIGICIGSNNNMIDNNSATDNSGYGIYNVYANNTKIVGNNFSGNKGWGIDLWCAYYVTIMNNTANSNGQTGINLRAQSSNNVLFNNSVSNNRCGIGLEDSSNNFVSNNNVTANRYVGINLDLQSYYLDMPPASSSKHNNITANHVVNNNIGVRLFNASDNAIFHNNIIGNKAQTSIDSASVGNTWNDIYPSAGNYWSDFNPADENKDKIGDVSYKIDENNTDRYPLIYPFECYESGYTPEPDLNMDGIVNIIDITLVARTFSCEPGDLNWNPVTDIDMNEIIDIIDVAAVARYFGKTV